MSELAKHFKKSTNEPPTFESFSPPKQHKSISKQAKQSSSKQTINTGSIESDESENESQNKIDRSEQDKYTIYVGNLPTTYNVKKLTKLFKEIGEIKSTRIRAVSTSKAKIPAHMVLKHKMPSVKSLYGYVVFTKIKHTQKAVAKLNGQLVAGRHINVDLCNKNEKKDFKTTVFISNLHTEVDEEKIWEFFAECGQVLKAHIVSDRVTGESKNFGFVTFKEKSDLILALKKHGEDLQGRNVVVRKANAKHKNIDSTKKRIIHKTPRNVKNRKNTQLKGAKIEKVTDKQKHKSKQVRENKSPETSPKQKKFSQVNTPKQQQKQHKKSKKFAKMKTKMRNPLLPKKPQTKTKT